MTALSLRISERGSFMLGSKVRVLVIDDSVIIRKYLTQILEADEWIDFAGTAPNGKIGLQKIFLLKPDVVLLDIEMPEMNGLEVLKYLKDLPKDAYRPHVIMFSSLVSEGSDATFEALSLGASDFIKKPDGQISENLDYVRKELELKIAGLNKTKEEVAAEIQKGTPAGIPTAPAPSTGMPPEFYGLEMLELLISKKMYRPEIIAVGSSTGGPVALRRIFDELGPLPVPMVIAQHMPQGFTSEFAKNLCHLYHREFAELTDGQTLKPGVIYICPGGTHATIRRENGNLTFRADGNTYDGLFFKPSVDLFFRSVREAVGNKVLALVLSGMGKDGSLESVDIRKSGAMVFAQDQMSSVVWGMPGNTVKNGGADLVLPIDNMGAAINTVIQRAFR